MDNLELALELIRRAQQERKRLDAYNAELKKYYASESRNWDARSAIERKYSPTPRKAIINDSLKMVRRLLSGEYV